MKQLIITIAALLLVGCGGSESFTEIISNPWTWIAILPFLYSVLSAVLSFVLGGAIIIVGYFLVKFLFPKKTRTKRLKNWKLKGNETSMTLKTKRTVPIFATVLLVLATIGFGFLWVFFAMLGTFQPGYLKDNDLVMIIYYSPWYIAGLWIVNLIVILRNMFTRKNREVSD